MKRLLITKTLLICCAMTIMAQTTTFETATEAVTNMKIGWNLGNTLDSHTGYTGSDWRYWETVWSEPVTTPKVIRMMKQAGFNTIRVPVTWYPHMDTTGKVDSAWMKRVHEVVDYVIDEGMYCLLNVHHDTGAHDTSWIIADIDDYAQKKERFEYLWTQIANEFKDYGQHLLFEGYNEMLDPLWSWGYASFKADGKYNAEIAASAYAAVNAYAQSFVDAVRATGGNNTQRNLVCSIYCASEGTGADWNTHLQDPVKEMVMPTDLTENDKNHLAVEMHYYRTLPDIVTVKHYVDFLMDNLQTYLADRLGVPVIIGEWGPRYEDTDNISYDSESDMLFEYASYLVKKAKEHNFATIYWMGMSNKFARLWPYFNQPNLARTVLKAYYGDDYDPEIPTLEDYEYDYTTITFTDAWGEFHIYKGDTLDLNEYKSVVVELAEPPATDDNFHVRGYGNPADTDHMSSINLTKTDNKITLDFDATKMNGKLTRAVIATRKAREENIKVKRAYLVKHDGTEIETELSRRNRCLITDITAHLKSVPTNIPATRPSTTTTDNQWYTLDGRRLNTKPSVNGIYIHNGQKIVIPPQ